jgi:hypothetical protein
MLFPRIATCVALVGVLTTSATPTHASITIDITQVGSDVVASGSGTIDLRDLSYSFTGFTQANMAPSAGLISMGVAPGLNLADAYTGFTGPSAFGPGTQTQASSGSGSTFAIQVTGDPAGVPILVVPAGYGSGTFLSATDTYSGQTFANLGLTPGTNTWRWGTGADADSLTVQIGPAAVVPEPSTAIGAVVAAVAFLAYGWSRHRRHQRRQAAARPSRAEFRGHHT